MEFVCHQQRTGKLRDQAGKNEIHLRLLCGKTSRASHVSLSAGSCLHVQEILRGMILKTLKDVMVFSARARGSAGSAEGRFALPQVWKRKTQQAPELCLVTSSCHESLAQTTHLESRVAKTLNLTVRKHLLSSFLTAYLTCFDCRFAQEARSKQRPQRLQSINTVKRSIWSP